MYGNSNDLPNNLSQKGLRNIQSVSLWDSLCYNLIHVIPIYLQGIFTRNRFWVSFWTKFHPDPLSVRFGRHLRRKYRKDYLYIHILTTRSLLVFDLDGIQHVLDHSPQIYADARLKREGMSHFQPNALTISRGEEWKERRRFNETVLNTPCAMHHCAGYFLDVVRQEIQSRHQQSGPLRSWTDFDDLFEKITLQIIFGKAAREDTSLMGPLKQMMRESNRAFALGKSRYFDAFYQRIQTYLNSPQEPSLVALCRQAPSTESTRVENQIPHWMFAMDDSLAPNTVRALALIVAHTTVEERVRMEMGLYDLSTPQGITELKYLEGCVQEAMRLWPTVPWLVRETLTEDTLGGAVIPANTQVLILNNFNCRDRDTYPEADSFYPPLWLNDSVDYRFNHLSNGTQVCAGKAVALFIAKSVLATLLAKERYILKRPLLDPQKPMPDRFNYFDLIFDSHPC
ncbi:MAG TPA: cytochrome P450 [Chthonomonadaceae bacterium]|nr:cytochrome P450 [Chthonomonadaceae bacterium]